MKKVFFLLAVGIFSCGALLTNSAEAAPGPVCPDGLQTCAVDANNEVFHKGNKVKELEAVN